MAKEKPNNCGNTLKLQKNTIMINQKNKLRFTIGKNIKIKGKDKFRLKARQGSKYFEKFRLRLKARFIG